MPIENRVPDQVVVDVSRHLELSVSGVGGNGRPFGLTIQLTNIEAQKLAATLADFAEPPGQVRRRGIDAQTFFARLVERS